MEVLTFKYDVCFNKKEISKGWNCIINATFFWVDVIDEDHNDRRESIDSVVNSVVLLNYMPHHTGRSIIMYRRGSCCFETQNEHTIQTKPLGVKEGLLTL